MGLVTVTATAVITGGFPTPDATFTLIVDGAPSDTRAVYGTGLMFGNPFSEVWTVDGGYTGHAVRIHLRLSNPVGVVDYDSATVQIPPSACQYGGTYPNCNPAPTGGTGGHDAPRSRL